MSSYRVAARRATLIPGSANRAAALLGRLLPRLSEAMMARLMLGPRR